jgi:hypothetical protein
MPQFGGKNAKKKTSSSSTKRHFTVVMGNKEHGLYVSSSPSSAARKAVSKLCATDKKKKVKFSIREITQGSKKKTYGPYDGYIEKLKEPIELKGRVIKYKPVAKLSGKTGAKKGGMRGGDNEFEIKFISKDEAKLEFTQKNYNRESGGIVITDKSKNKKYFFEKKRQIEAQQLYCIYTDKSFADESSGPVSFTIINHETRLPELVLQEFRTKLVKECTEVISFRNPDNE